MTHPTPIPILLTMDVSMLNALSGLRAAERRFEVSAANVVNSRSEGYLPRRVQTIAQAQGGTRAVTVPVKPASVPVVDFDGTSGEADGVSQRPNVALEGEFVEQKLAQHAFNANLRLIETADEMTGTLIEAIA